jgi:16S rRNA (cytosine1402-N4)-methyltransferase
MPENKINWHKPVLLQQAINLLEVKKQQKYIDATLGNGGYSQEICRLGGNVLSIEADKRMIELTKKRYKNCPSAFWKIVQGNFSRIKEIAKENGFLPCKGIVFDLGISSLHYTSGRGFSFRDKDNLDMRLDEDNQTLTAHEIINTYPKDLLEEKLRYIAQEPMAFQIAEEISKKRKNLKINSAEELASIIKTVYESHNLKTKTHPATKTFMALRIMVNREYENLTKGLKQAFETLEIGGRLIVVSFHSGEDRITKLYFRKLVKQKEAEDLTKKGIKASFKEVKENHLSRSAILRGIEKIN